MFFNIEKYLTDLGLRFKTNSGNTHFLLNSCPQCRKANKLYINRETGQFICHYCVDRSDSDMKGGLVALVSKLSGITTAEAYLRIYNKALSPEQQDSMFSPQILFGTKIKEEEVEELGVLEEFYQMVEADILVRLDEKLHPTAFEYLTKRGLTASDIEKAECRIFNVKNKNHLKDSLMKLDINEKDARFYSNFIGRIIFPVRKNNRVVGFLGRDYGNFHGKLKILNTKSNFRAVTLWNLDSVKSSDTVVITESIINAIKCGVEKSVATFGKFITPAQYNELFKLNPKTKIILMPDVDAQDAANQNAETLNCHFSDVRIVHLPETLASNNKDYLDAGDYSKEENAQFLKNAKPESEDQQDSFDNSYIARLMTEVAKRPKIRKTFTKKQKS